MSSVLNVIHFDISGKDIKDEHFEKSDFIFLIEYTCQSVILGKDTKEEHP